MNPALVDIRDTVAALKSRSDAGRTVAAKSTAAPDAKWDQFPIDSALFTKLVSVGV
jgi:hypothetical protein